jgi:hypothetical protein
MKYILLSFLWLLTSCLNSDMSPESALKDFVEGRIGKVVEREFVLERVTGKMLQSFENMTDEDFAKFADMKNIKSESFKILSKSCQEKKCFLTYSVGYMTKDKEGDKVQFVSEVKKIAEMIQVEKKWLISDVSNIKTYHESKEPISPLE